jgi:hypothetical protein
VVFVVGVDNGFPLLFAILIRDVRQGRYGIDRGRMCDHRFKIVAQVAQVMFCQGYEDREQRMGALPCTEVARGAWVE